jgi:L1 cell adhesion molecule like protein
VLDKAKTILTWLETNNLAEKEEFEEKLKEVQQECAPIMTKLHQAGGKGSPVTQ